MQLTIYSFIILLLFGVGVSLLLIANMFFYTILGEVNGRLPQDQHISMVGVNLKYGRVLRLHAELFPRSIKRQRMKLLGLGGFLSMLAGFLTDIVHYGHW
jgi:hypothetical protein